MTAIMDNSITASIVFSFKGETFKPSTRFDLDIYMEKGLEIESGD